MATTAGAIMDKAAVLLNDQAKAIWNNDRLLPHIIDAFDELIQALDDVGAPVVREVSAVLDVAAGAATVTIPTDLVEVISVSERNDGSTGLFSPMREVDWLPERNSSTNLLEYQWREQTLNFVPATTNREIKIQYIKDLAELSSAGSQIDIKNSTRFLQYKTAAIAAAFRGENFERAKVLNTVAYEALDQLKRKAIRSMQGLPVRRKPYKFSSKFRV